MAMLTTMDEFARWAAMDGYALYVWGSYAVSAVLLGGMILLTWSERRQARRDLDRLEATGRRRDRRRATGSVADAARSGGGA